MKKKVIALVGRPNVGKSTLFNRLAIRDKAIVHDQPGVTRDRKYANAKIGPLEFIVIDTPGLEETTEDKLEYKMMQQTIEACKEADLTCLIIDGKTAITPIDKFFANFIRRYSKNYILVVNKCEAHHSLDPEYYKLGFGAPAGISAAHGNGMMDLYHLIDNKLNDIPKEKIEEENNAEIIVDPFKTDLVQIVVTGRPNAGKSTFVNAIIGSERMLTGAMPGLTRESVAIDWEYQDYKMRLIDTAGLRKRKSISAELEQLSASDAIRSINFANTVVLMLDAQNSLEQQDLKIASYVIEQGRGLVIAVNKWDLVREKEKYKKEFYLRIEENLAQIHGVSVIFISALNKENVNLVLDECIKTYALWNRKISTGKLNAWLKAATEKHQLPLLGNGRRLRLKYITQTKTRPPTFKIFANSPEHITDSYVKYLTNDLRTHCNLPGIPIRFIFDKSDNPYV